MSDINGNRTIKDLQQLQALPLSLKVSLTKARIRQWIQTYGEEKVIISFSGGKDSTVLLELVRQEYPNIKAAFVDTGLEYPEIRQFVKKFDSVIWLKPEVSFKRVIEKYGYPFITKQIAKRVYEWHNAIEKGRDITKTEAYREFTGTSYYIRPGFTEPRKSFHNKEKWMFLTEAPFKMSHKCCDIMKKNSFKSLGEHYPMTAQMAYESINRETNWLRHGCNAFDAKKPMSNPMAFWTDNDVLQYIKNKGIEICSVYGDIVEDEQLPGQMSWDEYVGFDIGTLNLKTTGCDRTGCMFCGFGCHMSKQGQSRFERMKYTHPKQYEYIMKPWDQGGLGYKEVIDWLNEHGGLDIKY